MNIIEPLLVGPETPVDAIRTIDGRIKIITDHDLIRYKLGLIDNPYDN